MSWRRRLRILANALTISRCLFAAAVVTAAVAPADIDARRRLGLIVTLNLLGWTSDLFDGWAARRSEQPAPVWAGVDQAADLLLLWGTAYALAAARFVPADWVGAYFLAAVLALALNPTKNMGQLTCVPLLLLPPAVCLRYRPQLALLYLGWAACAAAFFWRRLCTQAVDFIDRIPGRPRDWFRGVRNQMTKWY